MTRIGDLTITVYGVAEIHATLNTIIRRLDQMAVDQATFDAALTDFIADLDAGLAAIQAKLDEAGTPIDLSAEAAAISDAKAKFDAMVTKDTTPPTPPEPTP